MDAKFHQVHSDSMFWISDEECKKYRSMMKEWGAEWLFFCVVPAERPNKIIFIEQRELARCQDKYRMSFQINNNDGIDRESEIPAELYQRSVEQLKREGYDVTSIPQYPL